MSRPNLHRFPTNWTRGFGVRTVNAPVMSISRRKILHLRRRALAAARRRRRPRRSCSAATSPSALDALGGAEQALARCSARSGSSAAFACTVGAWRAALAAAGGRICPRRAAARLGVGCDGQLVRAGEARRRGEDRALLAGDRRARAALDSGRRLCSARRGALAGARRCCSSSRRRPARCRCGRSSCSAAIVAVLAAAGALSGRAAPPPAHRTGARRASPRSSARRARSRRVLGWTLGMVARAARRDDGRRGRARAPAPGARRAPRSSPRSTSPRRSRSRPGCIGIGSGAVAVALASRGIGMIAGARRRLRDSGGRDARQRQRRHARGALPRRLARGRPPLDAARRRPSVRRSRSRPESACSCSTRSRSAGL